MPTIDDLDAAYGAAVAFEVAMAKALGVSEVAQIASAEERLRSFLIARWEALTVEAAERSKQLVNEWAGEATVYENVHEIMERWAFEVSPQFVTEIERIYYLARKAGADKALGKTTASLTYDTEPVAPGPEVEKVTKAIDLDFDLVFDQVDEDAVAAMNGQNLFWIGEHYGTNVSAAVEETAKEVMIQGGASRAATAEAMERAMIGALSSLYVPNGYRGSSRSYMEGLTANAATTARVQGQVRSFEQIGITTYTIANPSDERTCPICGHMTGKVFTTRQARKQIDLVQAASTPEDVKAAAPWLTVKEMKAISPEAGFQSVSDSTDLSKANFNLPPFHFRCRCTVDVSEESSEFENLADVG